MQPLTLSMSRVSLSDSVCHSAMTLVDAVRFFSYCYFYYYGGFYLLPEKDSCHGTVCVAAT